MCTARNQYVTGIDLQNFERKANDMLQSCIIQKSNLRVLEKIGQGELFFFKQLVQSLCYYIIHKCITFFIITIFIFI